MFPAGCVSQVCCSSTAEAEDSSQPLLDTEDVGRQPGGGVIVHPGQFDVVSFLLHILQGALGSVLGGFKQVEARDSSISRR